jgi:membrane protein YqaA with SNARE-associated domain
VGGALDPSDAGFLLALLALGAASGLVPVINAEVLLTAAAVSRPELWLPASVSITAGQCAAKVLIYLTAREGSHRFGWAGAARRLGNRLSKIVRRERGAGPAAAARVRWEKLLGLLGAPLPGTAVVALSAALGLPPLALVSVMAGTARLRLPLFVMACLGGRLVRFVGIAWPIAHLASTAAPG